MKLSNTLTKQVQDFQPLEEGKVGIYSCGPTVYDHIHIGNLSAFIYADTLRRALKANDYNVKHVMNFTDVDDKTIGRSKEKYPDLEPMEALKKLTEDYSQIFLDDMKAVGNDVSALTFIKATDSIPQIQALIRELYDKKFAYTTDDGVYFSIEAYRSSSKKYGQLTEITEASTSESRIQNDEYDKGSPHDFALWKKQKAGEPAWDFELNGHDLKGRPGWHIECSAMSISLLGQPFDIHTGGVDLIFPHHENEIAQSTAGKDIDYAKFFVHNEHLLVDGNKMSKSLNNFYTLDDIKQKGFDPLAFRLLVLQAHYKSQAHFSWENLQAAQNRLQNLRAMASLKWQAVDQTETASSVVLTEVLKDLADLLANDLDTPAVLAYLSKVADQLNTLLVSKDAGNKFNNLADFEALLKGLDELLGLGLSDVQDIDESLKSTIQEREQARKSEDWAKSDELRHRLQGQGIGLRDTVAGPIWFRL